MLISCTQQSVGLPMLFVDGFHGEHQTIHQKEVEIYLFAYNILKAKSNKLMVQQLLMTKNHFFSFLVSHQRATFFIETSGHVFSFDTQKIENYSFHHFNFVRFVVQIQLIKKCQRVT